MIITFREVYSKASEHFIVKVHIIKNIETEKTKAYIVKIYKNEHKGYFSDNDLISTLVYPTLSNVDSQSIENRYKAFQQTLYDMFQFVFPDEEISVERVKNHFEINGYVLPKKSSTRLPLLTNNSMLVIEVERFINHVENMIEKMEKDKIRKIVRSMPTRYTIFDLSSQIEKSKLIKVQPLIPSTLP